MRADLVGKAIAGTGPQAGATLVWLLDGSFEVVRERPTEIDHLLSEARSAYLSDLRALLGEHHGES